MKIRKRISKSFAWLLSCSMVMVNITPAFAATEYTNSTHAVENQTITNTDGAQQTTVYAEIGSSFKVTIPKKVTLDGETKTGKYQVSVEGDIAGLETINVVPEETVSLTTKDKLSVTGAIAQDKIQWTYNEILGSNKVLGNGSISASDITAGEWNGHFYFNVSLEETTGSGDESGTEDKNQLMLTLSDDEVLMGSTDTVQVNAYIEGENVNDYVSWESNNENIIVNNGLVETTASAQVGDTATVTVTATSNASLFATDSEPLTATAQFTVTVIDMAYTTEGEDEVITSVDLEAGETKNIEVTIIPASVSGTVSWTTTAPAGINLVKNGNTVTVKIADDMAVGKTYDLVASYGNFSKLLTINIVAEEAHVHSYVANVTTEATCTTAGVRTYTCSCGDSYTEEISALGHDYVDDICTNCGDEKTYEAGLYDANGVMLCSWEESGIDSTCSNTYSRIKNNYPTTTKVVISDSVTSIGNYAFKKCTNLTSVTIPSSVTSIGAEAFTNCTSLTSVTIPSSVTSIGYAVFENCSSLTSVTIEEGVTSIGSAAFRYCTNLTSVTIPSSVTSIEYYAFGNCTSLTSVTIPSSVTSIGDRVFANCTNLTSVTIPSSVTSIGYFAFGNCSNLTSVTIGEGVTSIGEHAFNGCTNLTSVTIPNSVTSIGNYAFDWCDSLTSVTFKTTSGWYVGDSAGAKTTALSSSDLANKSTAATYLKSTYYTKYWTR